ncbi:MAG: prolipoprotein diacylglyceryl transferase [Chitinophagaceae bacterium]|nr:prolipoprotein diacylglyceryl transferase [Chitinophagaceae bacterium]MCW5926524.1 prolipoprotein diacylglyceryl transferase [Chitinophagaceae bacterium]
MLSPRLFISFFNKKINAFHFFGIIGFIAGGLLGILLCYLLQLDYRVILLMTFIGVAVFFLLAFAAKIITGEENIVYYHHEIAILLVCAVVLGILKEPVLIYLDITILGIAIFLAFGRIGCFNVGCCHGKPSDNGVVYTHEHVEAGFTRYYEGVRLLPVQLIESAFVFLVTAAGIYLLLYRYPPGTVLVVYTCVYGLFRFVVEFFRGDPERPYWKGLSEAQWTTLLLIAVSVILSVSGLIPLYQWHLIISCLIFIVSIGVIWKAGREDAVVSPQHIRQIAIALENTDRPEKIPRNSNKNVSIFQTDQGLNLSFGHIPDNEGSISHYTISLMKRKLSFSTAEKVAKIIRLLKKHKTPYNILQKENVYHITFRN